MRVLLDTHTFLWFVSDLTKLRRESLKILERNDCDAQISIASIWEISIKTSTGKLSVAGGFPSVETDLANNSIRTLPISFAHALTNNLLTFHHKDPFDRMIAAQAIVEGIDLVSKDDIFDSYFTDTEVKRIW
ncbi:MAG: type II toxin-antitoxin system VapC family toxin [Pyrinomonadaceae bacterium]